MNKCISHNFDKLRLNWDSDLIFDLDFFKTGELKLSLTNFWQIKFKLGLNFLLDSQISVNLTIK